MRTSEVEVILETFPSSYMIARYRSSMPHYKRRGRVLSTLSRPEIRAVALLPLCGFPCPSIELCSHRRSPLLRRWVCRSRPKLEEPPGERVAIVLVEWLYLVQRRNRGEVIERCVRVVASKGEYPSHSNQKSASDGCDLPQSSKVSLVFVLPLEADLAIPVGHFFCASATHICQCIVDRWSEEDADTIRDWTHGRLT